MQIPPGRPYHDPAKKIEPVLFNTADAPNIKSFNKMVNPDSIDLLRKQNGWAIVSTHLGKGFCREGKLDTKFEQSMKYLASSNGWFVPASQLLDYLKENTGVCEISCIRRSWMEYLHIIDRVKEKSMNSLSE
jgi:hypothetical protein